MVSFRCCVLSVLALPSMAVEKAAAEKCYALALSGGGDKGAYEAGVIQGLVNRLPAEERQWNIVTGISAGSIVASGAALFNLGDEVAMADFLVSTVTSFTKDDVYTNWAPFGVLTGLGQSGLYSTDPLASTLVDVLGSRTRGDRKITIGATEDSTGSLVTFDESDWTDTAAWASRVRASAAIPGLFESVTVDGQVLSDGGVMLGVDVFSAVNRCRESGFEDENIVVDIVSCDTDNGVKSWDQDSKDQSVDLLLRALSILQHNRQTSDIVDACTAYPKVNWRYYVKPSTSLPSNGLEFDKEEMLEMVKIGLSDASSATIGAACENAQANMATAVWGTVVV